MNTVRSRIEKIEEALGRVDAESEHMRAEVVAQQLSDLADAELDRLEQIIMRVDESTEGGELRLPLPDACEHLRDFIAHVDRDEVAYFAMLGSGKGLSHYQSGAR